MSMRKKETAVSAIGSMFADVKTDNAFGSGLGVKVTCIGAGSLPNNCAGMRDAVAAASYASSSSGDDFNTRAYHCPCRKRCVLLDVLLY